MKILTWNVHQNPKAWEYMEENIEPDICLFQEYSEKVDMKRSNWMKIIHRCVEGKDTYWDSVIAVKNLLVTDLGFEKYAGRVLVGEVTARDSRRICVIDIHAQSIGTYYTKWIERVLDDLESTIVANKDDLIFGGDLNIGIFFDKNEKTSDNKELIERIVSYGLKMHPETEQQTHRHHWKPEPKYPDDYIFVSRRWKTVSCHVLDDEEIREISDHNPVIVGIDE